MKRRIIGLILVATALAPVVWFGGVVMECEYPYALTMFRAAHAKTVAAADAAAVIANGLGVRRSRLAWHRCSFCENLDGELPRSMVRVQVSIVPREYYVFAFDARRGILYPADSKTETAFPKMRGFTALEVETNGNPNIGVQSRLASSPP